MDGKIKYRLTAFHTGERTVTVEFDNPFIAEVRHAGVVLVSTGQFDDEGKTVYKEIPQLDSRRSFEVVRVPVEMKNGKPDKEKLVAAVESMGRHLYLQFEQRAKAIANPASVALALGIGTMGIVDCTPVTVAAE